MARVAKEHGVTFEYVDGDVTVRIGPLQHPSKEHSSGEPVNTGGKAVWKPQPGLTRWSPEAKSIWKASIPGSKIGKREEAALRKLAAIGVNVRVLETEVKGCGNETMDRLQARGFIGRRQTLTEEEVRDNRTLEEIWLLKEGFDAWNRLATEVKKEWDFDL
jgi:hypothetical protein